MLGAGMRVGRDAGERLVNRIKSGVRFVPHEKLELLVRLHGKTPRADCLVATNARLLSIDTTQEPMHWIRHQVLADEIQTWHLSRKFRSRLVITSGYHRKNVFGSSLSTFDDDAVDEALTALVAGADVPDNAAAIRALRAEAHWVSSVYGRSIFVLDRTRVPSVTTEMLDLEMVDRQLAQLEYWPSSEVRRHLEVCLPAGGCYLARAGGLDDGRTAAVAASDVSAVADALVSVDVARLKKSAGQEAEVLQKLMSVAAHIRSNPIWQTSRLDDHDLRVDLNDEVRQIALRCDQAARLREEVGEAPPSDSKTGGRAADLHNASLASLDAVVKGLDDRVATMGSYRDRLRALARELADVEAATHIDDVAQRVAQLAAATVGDDATTDALVGLVPRSRDESEPIPQAIEALREDLYRLSTPDAQLPGVRG